MSVPLSPEATIRRAGLWPGEAVELSPLAGGRSNRSWLVCAGKDKAVLRLDSRRVPAPLVDRSRELRILEVAATAGLAPEVLHADPRHGILITRYVHGEIVSAETIADRTGQRQIAALLRRVHELPVVTETYTLSAAGECYLGRIERSSDRAVAKRLVTELNAVPPPPVDELGLCHMDPVCGNILKTARQLLLIDWEFAVTAERLLDLAVVASYHAFSPEQASGLLEAYTGTPTERQRSRLRLLVRVSDILHWLWLVAGGVKDEIERRRLEERLGLTP